MRQVDVAGEGHRVGGPGQSGALCAETFGRGEAQPRTPGLLACSPHLLAGSLALSVPPLPHLRGVLWLSRPVTLRKVSDTSNTIVGGKVLWCPLLSSEMLPSLFPSGHD